MIAILPVIMLIASSILYVLLNLALALTALILNISVSIYLLKILKVLLIIYLVLVVLTEIQFISEAKQINVTALTAITTCLLHPFYMFLYVPIGIKSLFVKNLGWSKIEHGQTNKNMESEVLYENDEARNASKKA